ncbi:MAG: aconitase X catalytic domain-containing protein [Archaeoglobi archaeon]|nr:aconitase X catalytic domain-containing protein [Candidatus Mnemosynella bozhongmuii]
MYLTKEEERILEGEFGETLEKAMRILVSLGEIYGASRLIPISSAHISGASYKTIGDAGLLYLSSLSSKVRCRATLNPVGMDRERWREMGISEDFFEKQMRIIECYRKLGVEDICSCTPYYFQRPSFGEHLAWSESNAVIYANSVCGARTNREGAPGALASALIGKTPLYGMHLKEERAPTVTVTVRDELRDEEFGALGYYLGGILRREKPIFRLQKEPTEDEMKKLGAAMAATGAVQIFHIENKTPEASLYPLPDERIEVGREEIKGILEFSDPDVIALGCPHLSEEEIKKIAVLLKGKRVEKDTWICTSREIRERCRKEIEIIERSGAKVICDTCMVVSPLLERYSCALVESGKALNYVPTMCGIDAQMTTIENCIKHAVGEI